MTAMSDTAFLERRRVSSPTRRLGEIDGASGRSSLGMGGREAGWLGLATIRIPVTRANRAVLREMRARELALWDEEASGTSSTGSSRVNVPREDRESQVILLLLAGAALALWLQAATAAVRFVEGWEAFRGWVTAMIG